MEDSTNTTIIAAMAQIKGELVFEGAALVIGKVEGKISANGDLHVDERGICNASINASNVQVDGSIEGDVTAAQRMQLNAQGRIKGDIVAEKLITAEGASIQGHVNVGPNAGKVRCGSGFKAEQAVAAAASRPDLAPGAKATTSPAAVK